MQCHAPPNVPGTLVEKIDDAWHQLICTQKGIFDRRIESNAAPERLGRCTVAVTGAVEWRDFGFGQLRPTRTDERDEELTKIVAGAVDDAHRIERDGGDLHASTLRT